jgi:cysteine desulfurase/selenocysteine lyase
MNCRDDFPLLAKHPVIYLDSAATAHKPACVIEALRKFYAEEYGTVHRAVYSLAAQATALYCEARERVQRFLNAQSSNEIVFTKGTTEGINLIAASYGSLLEEGDEILITEMEHHANIVPWQLLAERRKLVLKVAPVNDQGELILEEFERLLTSQTKIVAIAHIANATGTWNPISALSALAHRKGAVVVIDGAQAAPHMLVDVQALDADFYLFSGHKAFGPTGIGVLYGKEALLKKMPPYQSGGDMIATVSFEATTFQEPPLRFEAGTPMVAEVIGLKAALDYIETLGRDKMHAYEMQLHDYAAKRLLEIPGLRLIGTAREKGAILTFTIDGIHPLDIGTFLDLKKIAIRTGHLCAQPILRRFGVNTAARISFAPYNTFSEIDTLIDALSRIHSLLTP